MNGGTEAGLGLTPFPPPKEARLDYAHPLVMAALRASAASREAESERLWLQTELERTGLVDRGAEPAIEVTLLLDPASVPENEGFRLELDGGKRPKVRLIARDLRGLRYAGQALLELLQLNPNASGAAAHDEPRRTLPSGVIRDWPDFAHRGVMLDVSRDRVPTMATLFATVDRLAGWRINQLQLYMEHTFAYRGHEVVWRDASPFTAAEIQELDRFCRARHIELVPNQNTLGHFHRWLVHEPYRGLAECPDGYVTLFTPNGEPYSLCPTDPGSLRLIEDLFDQLLPNFTSGLANAGLDETFDLGHGRSAEACGERGVEQVYLEYLKSVHAMLARRGLRLQFWGDVILNRPELIRELPADAIALEWGYDADHPFAADTAQFAEAGLEFYVCPGTSSWNSIGGRTENALRNLASAAIHGSAAGATGMLITDWGDHGHWQPEPVSYLGLLAGAAFAWNVSAARSWVPAPDAPFDAQARERWASLLGRLAFADASGALGRAAFDLGNAGQITGARNRNGSPLFRFFHFADRVWPHSEIVDLTPEGLERAAQLLDSVPPLLSQARSSRPDAATIRSELMWVTDLLKVAVGLGRARMAAGDGNRVGQIDQGTRVDLAEELRELALRHRALWESRSRPGGLRESVARFERLRELLLGE